MALLLIAVLGAAFLATLLPGPPTSRAVRGLCVGIGVSVVWAVTGVAAAQPAQPPASVNCLPKHGCLAGPIAATSQPWIPAFWLAVLFAFALLAMIVGRRAASTRAACATYSRPIGDGATVCPHCETRVLQPSW